MMYPSLTDLQCCFFMKEIDKLKKRLAEAEAAQEASKKTEEKAQKAIVPGDALHEWVML